MTTDKKHKKDKEILLSLEVQIKDIKHQLTEQLKCLDGRLDNQQAIANEFYDFFQKRAEVEMEYSKSLEKISRQIIARHKAEKQKRESWQSYTSCKLWHQLLSTTTSQVQQRSNLSDCISTLTQIIITRLKEDLSRIYKKCYEIAVSLHGELHKSMTELHGFLKTYQTYHGESQQLEGKLLRAQTQKLKFEEDNKKGTLSKKTNNYHKKTEKQRLKVQEAKLKATKARNEYLISLESTNSALRKYFINDLPEIINAMDYTYHLSLELVSSHCIKLFLAGNQVQDNNFKVILDKIKDINQTQDRHHFLQQNQQIFTLPKKFQFLSHKGDEICQIENLPQLQDELSFRFSTISGRIRSLRLENDELWKTIETADNSIITRLTSLDLDYLALIKSSPPVIIKNEFEDEKVAREWMDTQDFYFSKLKTYQLNNNLIGRLQSKSKLFQTIISDNLNKQPANQVRPLRKRRILGKSTLESKPRLFGGSVLEYVNATCQEIPIVIRSCTKIINLYGMHQQGVFRIPGPQHEINEFKTMFERGEEPLLSKLESRDINSVAGVLKLYLRELSEPLFPVPLFDALISCAKFKLDESGELERCIEKLQDLLLPLPKPLLVVIRYLFAFLNHVTEYSDENMMDACNLSICFGPSLLPVPPDHVHVNYQNQINDLVRILIEFQEKIFPKDEGETYEKFIVDEEGDLEDSVDSALEGMGENLAEEDVLNTIEAIVINDTEKNNANNNIDKKFNNNSNKECYLKLRKGEWVEVLKRGSKEAWLARDSSGRTGLILTDHLVLINKKRKPVLSLGEEEKDLLTSPEDSLISLRSSSVTMETINIDDKDKKNTFFNKSEKNKLSPRKGEESKMDRSHSQPNILEDKKNKKKKEVKEESGRNGKVKNEEISFSSSSTLTFNDVLEIKSSKESLESKGSHKQQNQDEEDEAEITHHPSLIPVLEIQEPLEVQFEFKQPTNQIKAKVSFGNNDVKSNALIASDRTPSSSFSFSQFIPNSTFVSTSKSRQTPVSFSSTFFISSTCTNKSSHFSSTGLLVDNKYHTENEDKINKRDFDNKTKDVEKNHNKDPEIIDLLQIEEGEDEEFPPPPSEFKTPQTSQTSLSYFSPSSSFLKNNSSSSSTVNSNHNPNQKLNHVFSSSNYSSISSFPTSNLPLPYLEIPSVLNFIQKQKQQNEEKNQKYFSKDQPKLHQSFKPHQLHHSYPAPLRNNPSTLNPHFHHNTLPCSSSFSFSSNIQQTNSCSTTKQLNEQFKSASFIISSAKLFDKSSLSSFTPFSSSSSSFLSLSSPHSSFSFQPSSSSSSSLSSIKKNSKLSSLTLASPVLSFYTTQIPTSSFSSSSSSSFSSHTFCPSNVSSSSNLKPPVLKKPHL